jgi:hypothetical protein
MLESVAQATVAWISVRLAIDDCGERQNGCVRVRPCQRSATLIPDDNELFAS